MLKKTKNLNSLFRFFFGGVERIRTAVGAFAEPSLATRPRRQNQIANLTKFNKLASVLGFIVGGIKLPTANILNDKSDVF